MTEISFIIAAYNDGRLIGSAIDNLIGIIERSGADAEILVGIDLAGPRGKDATESEARARARRFKRLRVFTSRSKKGKNKTVDMLINRARGDIIINHDADKLFSGDLGSIKRTFMDPAVGGIVGMDNLDAEFYNRGQQIFEKTYDGVKLSRHSDRGSVTSPIFCTFIFRKSALAKPYISSPNGDDFETTYRLLKSGHRVIVIDRLTYCFCDNPMCGRLTADAVAKRRFRGETFKYMAKDLFGIADYLSGERMAEFAYAALLALKKANMRERFEILDYLRLAASSTVAARLKMALRPGEDPWKYRVR